MSNIAAVFHRQGERLVTETRPIPKPQAHQLLVRNRAVATNPVDYMNQDMCFYVTKLPNILGSDVSGTVEAIGEGVTRFKKGDRVSGYAAFIANNNIDEGAFQEYTLVNEHITSKLPDAVTFEQGATLPMAVATVGMGLFVELGIPTTGKQSGGFLVWGAASSVGTAAVQMAAAWGFTVFATASPQHHDYIKSLGAQAVFDYKDDKVVDRVVAAAKAEKLTITLGYDTITAKGSSVGCAKILDAFGGGKLAQTLPWQGEKLPESVTASMVKAFSVVSDEKTIGKFLFNEYLEKALVDKTFVPSPPVQIVEGGIDAIQTAIDTHKAGISGKKLVVPLP